MHGLMMARRKKATTYDRQAGGEGTVTVIVDDPYEPGARLRVSAAVRDDPLRGLYARHQIGEAEFLAGRRWQRAWEQASAGDLRGMDTTREPVDGGGRVEPISSERQEAVEDLAHWGAILGRFANGLISDVLGRGMSLSTCAAARGMNSQPASVDVRYLGGALRVSLNELAIEMGIEVRAVGRKHGKIVGGAL